jgi:hypothetical protein
VTPLWSAACPPWRTLRFAAFLECGGPPRGFRRSQNSTPLCHPPQMIRERCLEPPPFLALRLFRSAAPACRRQGSTPLCRNRSRLHHVASFGICLSAPWLSFPFSPLPRPLQSLLASPATAQTLVFLECGGPPRGFRRSRNSTPLCRNPKHLRAVASPYSISAEFTEKSSLILIPSDLIRITVSQNDLSAVL